MPVPATFKICLVGSEGVGKTSLVRRFVEASFEPEYIRTLGVTVSKKRMPLDGGRPGDYMTLVLWDIMGDFDFFSNVAEAYLHGANGIFAVLDLTRPETLPGLQRWWEVVRRGLPKTVGVIAANKADLPGRRVARGELEELGRRLGWPWFETSALDGRGVEEAFASLREALLKRLRGPPPEP